MKLLSWQNVVAAGIVTGGFLGIYYLSDANGKSTLINVVSGIATTVVGALVLRGQQRQAAEQARQADELKAIKDHVNGNTRKLIEKIPEAERPAVIPQID
jgi:ABC-type uncharacterized transport system ATPase component